MKRLLSTAILCALVSVSFAQKKAVKEAKKAMDSNKLADARGLIKPALTDPETATDPETWKVAGDIDYKDFNNEGEKKLKSKFTSETANDDVMYMGLYNSYLPYIKADSLGELPDEKGKVKNKVRKDIVQKMKAGHPEFYNGGAYYNEKKEYAKATDFFERYWDLPYLKMFEGDKDNEKLTTDSIFQIVKYYAVISALQGKDTDRTIKLLEKLKNESFFVENSVYSENTVYELLANEYQVKKDNSNFIETLKEGATKFPGNPYFVSNLINEYIRAKQSDEAIAYLDQAISNPSSNKCELYSVKASIYGEKEDYDTAAEIYQKALDSDANCERALENLGIVYMNKARIVKEAATKLPSQKERIEEDDRGNEFLKKAYPILDKYRSLLEARNADTSEIKAALYKLQNIYYILNMNEEYEATSKRYGSM